VRTIEETFSLRYRYPVSFTRAALAPANDTLARILARAGSQQHRVLPVIDSGALAALPDLGRRLAAYADSHRDRLALVAEPLVLPGGEISKSDPAVLEEVRDRIARHRICRHSFILAIGGGAVLDATGYAAATAHRGVRLVRLPTTVLAQCDAGIGVKNAINFRSRKNFLGTFAPPFAVINDLDFLDTLAPRDLRSGVAEAVKVALIRDRDFFDRLHTRRRALAAFERDAMEDMILRCAGLHLEHIRDSGDPFELGSARPLDFGHWSAHKLEELSGHRLRHGEAVAIGIALDTYYSHARGMIQAGARDRVLTLLEDVGFALQDEGLGRLDVATALADFREHLGGDLCITLLADLGQGIEVREIDVDLMRACIHDLQRRAAAAAGGR
jgi:3-dehydroquinate synthase